jgi:hypothetical protein
MTAKARCEICNIRPVMTARQARQHGVSFPYCDPCMTQADWENTHSDYGHDADAETIVPWNDEEAADGHRVEGCWICFPELDETTRPYTQRVGTSRAGMVLNVVPLEAAKTKAGVVAEALSALGIESRIRTNKGITTLKATNGEDEIVVVWDGRRYSHGTGAGRRLRNVADVLRFIAK